MKEKLRLDLAAMGNGNIITESGMDFIADNTFPIESFTCSLNLEKVRSVEFIRIKHNRLIFVEAKTSFPNPDNPNGENLENFQREINKSCEKFEHSLSLYSSIKVGVMDDVLPEDFNPPSRVLLVFVLVVKNHHIKWCNPVKQKLIEKLPVYLRKIWRPEVYVINHETAAKQQLTTSREDNCKAELKV